MKYISISNTNFICKAVNENTVREFAELLIPTLQKFYEKMSMRSCTSRSEGFKKLASIEMEILNITNREFAWAIELSPKKGTGWHFLCDVWVENGEYWMHLDIADYSKVFEIKDLSKKTVLNLVEGLLKPALQNWWTMKAEEPWDTPIKQFVEDGEIPARALHYFRQAGIRYPREVQWYNKPYPKMFRNFGKETCKEVLKFIHGLGLKYQDE
jgi:hypothetical protein